MPARIRKGDLVAVISGDDRGKRGRVLRVIPETGKVVVEGLNLVTKHLRKSAQNPQGGRVRREAAMPASKVMPVDPQTNQPTRVKAAVVDGRTVRVGVRSGARIDAAAPSRREKAAKKASGGGEE